jgi:NADPH-dependent 2,4-dienoyl-CoA reductase/sulfur reductase-like enzyme
VRVVIIGAGPAGVTVAENLRRLDPDVHVTLLSGEPYPPYSPPAMADHFSTGREETLFWKGQDVHRRWGVDYLEGSVVASVRPEHREILLEDGSDIPYDRLVIASGSRLFAPLEGCDLPGVYNFKSLSAARALVDRVRTGEARTALIVGAGFIGVEVALLLSDLGVEVTVLEALDRVMPEMLDPETAAIVLDELKRRNVRVRPDTRARSFQGGRTVEGLELESGELVQAHVYVAATGVKPNVEFLEDSGIDTHWGIRVDDHMRTSVRDVYAAGDVAETRDRMTGERYVHAIFPNAVAQGEVVAENLLGYDAAYPGSESMNSLKHLGIPVVAVGAADGEEELRWRHGKALRKVFLTDGRIVGFRLTGDIRAAGVYRSLMLRAADVTPFRSILVDPRFSVGDLVLAVA